MQGKSSGVPLVIPSDIWQDMGDIRAQLDSEVPGAPTPMIEVLREMVLHFKHCSSVEGEVESFRKRAEAWK